MTSNITTYDAPRTLSGHELECVGGGNFGSTSRPLVPPPSAVPDVTATFTYSNAGSFGTVTIGRFCDCILDESWTFW